MNKKRTEGMSDRKQFGTLKKEYKRFWDLRPEYHQIVIRGKYGTEEKRFIAWLINIKFKEWLESKRADDKGRLIVAIDGFSRSGRIVCKTENLCQAIEKIYGGRDEK